MNDFNYFFSLLILLILFKNIKKQFEVIGVKPVQLLVLARFVIQEIIYLIPNDIHVAHIVKHVHIMNNVMFVIQDIIYLDIHVNNVAQVVRPVHALLLIVPPVNQDNIYQAFLAILALVNVKPVLVLPTVNLVKVDIF